MIPAHVMMMDACTNDLTASSQKPKFLSKIAKISKFQRTLVSAAKLIKLQIKLL